MKTLLLLSIFVFPIYIVGQEKKTDNFIYIEYGGPPLDKSIPPVVFCNGPFIKEGFNFEFTFDVAKCEYLAILKIILEDSIAVALDSSQGAYYYFNVFKKGKKQRFGLSNLDKLKQIFKAISDQIEESGKREDVEAVFSDILRRIG